MANQPENLHNICIIGRGNVGSHLAIAFRGAGCNVSVADPRTLDGLSPAASLYIISVSDDAIESVAQTLHSVLRDSHKAETRTYTVAHTSGGIGIDKLIGTFGDQSHVGVIYPMQTFSKGVDMDYSDIPFFIEGSDTFSEKALIDAASLISRDVSLADSSVRRDYHIAAVFACNFSNFMFAKADEYLASKNLDFKKMLPLIDRTCRKIHTISPEEAQTGPAIRHDHTVMRSHLRRLADNPALSELYTFISQKIMQ